MEKLHHFLSTTILEHFEFLGVCKGKLLSQTTAYAAKNLG